MIDLRIVVNEYPKSGGNWIVNLIGDALGLPKRDIYDVKNTVKSFDLSKHPWYGGMNQPDLPVSCVIKSHEYPDSQLLKFPAAIVHLIRDGRDVVVSKYFYERDFCVDNGIYQHFDIPFDEYVPQVAREWRNYILAWHEVMPQAVCQYENFLADPRRALQHVFAQLGIIVSCADLSKAVEANIKDKMRRSLDNAFQHNSFIRKGIAGDWRNYFSDTHIQAFKEQAGDALIQLGYEIDGDWTNEICTKRAVE